MTLIDAAKETSMLFKRVGDMKAWELYVANAIFLFLATLIINQLQKVLPKLLGGESGDFVSNALTLTKAATVTGEYEPSKA